MNLLEIRKTLNQVMTFALPIIQVVVPGSDIAKKVADVLGVVNKYLAVGDAAAQQLEDLSKKMVAIHDEVEAMVKSGQKGVDAAKWAELRSGIDDAMARIKAAKD